MFNENELNWTEVKLNEVISFNPREHLKKGTICKKIGMDKLKEFSRDITGYEETKFTSGTKFRNGDTLLARITPCLQNGKTAQVNILEENEVAFGSTEYIILRAKPNISDENFIYYLSISKNFRDIAIKSMTGTSGRQRAQKDVIENTLINFPSLKEQQKIGKILKSIDDKIKLNNQMNQTLEEMAQAIFKEWFVDFNFPNEDGIPYKDNGGEMVESELGLIPEGWRVTELKDFIKFIKGKKPKNISENKINEDQQQYLTIKSYTGNDLTFADTDKIILANEKDTVMVMDGASSGTIFFGKKGIVGSTLAKLEVKQLNSDFLFYLLKSYENEIKKHLTGSAIPHTDKEFINKIKIAFPTNSFNFNTFTNIRNKIIILNNETENLIKTRDSLLPKLMSGEIRV